MIKPRTTFCALLLVTATLLSSCGLGSTPAQSTAQSLPSSFKYLHTLSVAPGVSKAELQQRYGGSVIGYYPEDGRAVLATNSPSLESSTLGVQALSSEPNSDDYSITEQGMGIWATGFGAWATGFGAWATGYGAWATGSTTATTSTTFQANVPFWNMIKLSEAQSIAPQLGQGIKVAVIDSGIDLRHPMFQGKLDLVNAKDFIGNDASPQEVNSNTSGGYSAGYGHGTSVASIILQMAPKATILPIRVLDASGGGDTATIITAISLAKDKGAKVINLSLGSPTYSAALDSAIKDAVSSGITVVCASGNTGDTNIIYPAASAKGTTTASGAGSVSVGSVNAKFLKSSFSTYGPALELTAPGENVTAAFPGGKFIKASGTSFAAPVVSGVLALGLSTGIPTTTGRDVQAMLANLNSTATLPTDPTYKASLGNGTVNAYAFINKYR